MKVSKIKIKKTKMINKNKILEEIKTIKEDNFIVYEGLDTKRFLAFDFVKNKVHVIDEELIDKYDVTLQKTKEIFPDLIVVNQRAKLTEFIETHDNEAAHDRAKMIFTMNKLKERKESKKEEELRVKEELEKEMAKEPKKPKMKLR